MIRFAHDILPSNTTASTFVYFLRTRQYLNRMAKRMAHSRMARFAVFWFNVFALVIFTNPVSASSTTIPSKFFDFLLNMEDLLSGIGKDVFHFINRRYRNSCLVFSCAQK